MTPSPGFRPSARHLEEGDDIIRSLDLSGGHLSAGRATWSPSAGFYAGEACEVLRESLDAAEPCTLLHPQVEVILQAVNRSDDWGPFRAKLNEIERMRVAYETSGGSYD